MAEQEITYTVEEKKSETVTVCDGCGVEVEPGENCRTLVSADIENDEISNFFPGHVHLEGDSYKLRGDHLYVRVEGFFETFEETFEDPFHYCFDCWEGVNLSVDEKSLSMSESYSDRVRKRAKHELGRELREETFRRRLLNSSKEDLVTAIMMLAFSAVSVALSLQHTAAIPIAVVVSILAILTVSDLLQVRL